MSTSHRPIITLSIINGIWCAKFSDPEIKFYMGADTIPTPYRASTPAETVKRAIQARNVDSTVIIADRPVFGPMAV
jgi:hypothetical protein